MYKLIYNPLGPINVAMNLETNTSFPFDPANTDAQQFAKWLKEGNVPEPAVEGEQVTQEWIDQTIALLLPNG